MQEAFVNSCGIAAEDLSVSHSMCGHVILIPGEMLLANKKDTALIVQAFRKTEKYLLDHIGESKRNG